MGHGPASERFRDVAHPPPLVPTGAVLERGGGLEAAAFERVRAGLAKLPGVDPLIVAAVEAAFHGRELSSFSPSVLGAADAVDWQEDAAPGLLRRMVAYDDRFAGYPTASRVMPTRLGNTLRSTEDELKNVDGDLRGFVVRNLDKIPRSVLQEHDQYRNRLDMYCMFVLVCAALAVAGPALLLTARPDPAFGVASGAGYLLLAVVG